MSRSRRRPAPVALPPPRPEPITPRRAETVAKQFRRAQQAVSGGFALAVGRSADGELLLRVGFQGGVPQSVVAELEVVERKAVRIPISPDAPGLEVPAVVAEPGPVAAAG